MLNSFFAFTFVGSVWWKQCLAKDLTFSFRPSLDLGTCTLENIFGRSPLIRYFIILCFIAGFDFALEILLTTFNLRWLNILQSLPRVSVLIIPYTFSFILFLSVLVSVRLKNLRANFPPTLCVNSPGKRWMMVADFSFHSFRFVCGCGKSLVSFSSVCKSLVATAGLVESASKRGT